jgi:endonuclease YncB( thermonuclease family)
LILIIALIAMVAMAWFYAKLTDDRETITRLPKQAIYTADGDSFSIDKRKLRLRGIDAPELKQSCQDENGHDWACGRAAQGALTLLLSEPGLTCEAEALDRFGRALASCSTSTTPDIAARQVADAYGGANSSIHATGGTRTRGVSDQAARLARS